MIEILMYSDSADQQMLSQIPDRKYEIINICCFKSLNFEGGCYVIIKNIPSIATIGNSIKPVQRGWDLVSGM